MYSIYNLFLLSFLIYFGFFILFLKCKYLIASGIHCIKLFSLPKNAFVRYPISNNRVLFENIHCDGRFVLLFIVTAPNFFPPINDRMCLKITNKK